MVASVVMILWGSKPYEISRPSKGVAVFGVSVLALLIGVTLVVNVTSGPAYEATAVFTVGVDDPDSRPDLAGEGGVLQSPRIANDAAALDPEQFVWYQPDLDVAPAIDSDLIQRNRRIETDAEADAISVHVVADEPAVAWVGANLVVEAYLRFRPEVGTSPACGGVPRMNCPPLEPSTVSSVSFASVPTSRIDRPDPADVALYVLASVLAVYLTWRWWPTALRQTSGWSRVDSNSA
jgi:hypothetical protein